jgi:hypothetical protein
VSIGDVRSRFSQSSTSLLSNVSPTSAAKPNKIYPRARRQFSISTEFPSKNKWSYSPDSRTNTSDNIFLATKNFWDSKTEAAKENASNNNNKPKTLPRKTDSSFGSQKEISGGGVSSRIATIVDVVDESSLFMKKFASEKNLSKFEMEMRSHTVRKTVVTVPDVDETPVATPTVAVEPAKRSPWTSESCNKTDGEKWNELQRKYSSSGDIPCAVDAKSRLAQRPKDLAMGAKAKSPFSSPITTPTGPTAPVFPGGNKRGQERAPVKALAQRWEQMSQSQPSSSPP